MADFVRHGYLLKGVDVKYNDTKLMVGYETLEFETLIFETSSSWFQKAMCLMSRIYRWTRVSDQLTVHYLKTPR